LTRTHMLCDLTQSYAETGGGIRTYLAEKRAFIDANTGHRHLLIVPGAEDRVTHEGRHMTVEIASPRVPGSPNYRLLLRSGAVVRALREMQPATIECLCAYNLPWAAIYHRRKSPDVSLIAGYRTDFPTVYIEPVTRRILGGWAARGLQRLAYAYAGKLYSKFDGVYALNGGMADRLSSLGADEVDVLPLGIDTAIFHPSKRSENWRAKIGAEPDDLVLIYAGRIDKEKEADVVLDAFAALPDALNAHLVMLGDGKLKAELEERAKGKRVHFTGFVKNRAMLAMMLASSDVYVSAMAHETFGISIIEAQAAGLPVVGVKAGAMPDRVSRKLGLLGPVGDAEAMAANITRLWQSGVARATGKRARLHVEAHYSWQRTFEHLFGHIYPKATGFDLLGEASGAPLHDWEPAPEPTVQPSGQPDLQPDLQPQPQPSAIPASRFA